MKYNCYCFQKLDFPSSSEGSTVNVALFGEEKAEAEPEKASELQACFTEGMFYRRRGNKTGLQQALAVQESYLLQQSLILVLQVI